MTRLLSKRMLWQFYLYELQEQGSLNEAIAKRLLAKGMSVADVAEAMQMTEESVAKLQKK